MRRPSPLPQDALDQRLSLALHGAVLAEEPPVEARSRLLRAAGRMEGELAWEREAMYHKAQWSITLHLAGPSPLFGWMTLPLQHNYLLGFPKPRFSW